ncbi:hypothetical protein [Rhodopseudomonas palustris]|uniref:hypothetical protein n=1 Tax=Rhodopseudomonas palustris TaxID=1076 RepID=UPI00142F19D7
MGSISLLATALIEPSAGHCGPNRGSGERQNASPNGGLLALSGGLNGTSGGADERPDATTTNLEYSSATVSRDSWHDAVSSNRHPARAILPDPSIAFSARLVGLTRYACSVSTATSSA